MPAKNRLLLLFIVAVFALSNVAGFAASGDQRERIDASYMLGLGRAPSNEEIKQWMSQGNRPISEILGEIRKQLRENKSMEQSTMVRAFEDAFGRPPKRGELTSDSAGEPGADYGDLMKRHLSTLAENPAEYEEAIQRAYQHVIRRDAYAEEIEYWKQKGTFSYVLLVGCIEDWARRNQPGLMVTAGTPTISVNSEFLTTARLSPAVAAEARAAAGFEPPGEDGNHLVAPGAGAIVSGGRIHFAVAGPARPSA